MEDEITVLAHWPFVRAHLAFDRSPATLRLLDFVAEQQAKTLEPTAISAGWLRQWGMTAGEAGRARTVAGQLQKAGVLHRWRGAGPRPDVWQLTGRLERWRVPWRTSGRAVATVIGACKCRARFAEAARVPGQEGCLAARVPLAAPVFALGPDAHQDIRVPWRAAFDEPRAAFARLTPSDLDFQNPPARLSAVPDAPSTSPIEDGKTTSSSSRDDDDVEVTSEAGKVLLRAIVQATGGTLWGAPARRLERVARDAGPHLDRLAAELAVQRWARSPVALVDRAEALLPVVAKEAAEQLAEAGRGAAKRRALLEQLEAQDLLDDRARAELDSLREDASALR